VTPTRPRDQGSELGVSPASSATGSAPRKATGITQVRPIEDDILRGRFALMDRGQDNDESVQLPPKKKLAKGKSLTSAGNMKALSDILKSMDANAVSKLLATLKKARACTCCISLG
jgi:hypothetical protein